MSEQAITVIAKIVAKPDQIDTVKHELQSLIEPTRAEAGCIDYILHQHTENPAVFVFYENWTRQQALDEHLQKPHLTAFAAKAEALLAEPLDIQILTKV
jgi:quinol monooxygenase YgiN